MEILRDVTLGALMWLLSFGAFVSMITGCAYLWGPPIADRARSFTYIMGGGMALLLIAICVFVTIIMSSRSA